MQKVAARTALRRSINAASRRSVKGIAGDRVADAGQVNTDLMGSARADADFEECEAAEAAEHMVFGLCCAAFVKASCHAGAPDRIAGNRPLDAAGVLFDAVVDQGQVDLLHLPFRKLRGKGM